MKYKHSILRFALTLFCLTFFPATLFAATAPAGVPSNALWFSQDPFFVGETVTVFTVVYNSTNYRLSGTMELRDGTSTVGTKDFIVETLGASQIVSFPWTVTSGNHLFTVIITQNELRKEGGSVLTDPLQTLKTTGAKRFADLDTDHDRLGNAVDTDDDGDGLTDVEEKKKKTDTLNKDTDGDGISDDTDPQPLVKSAPTEATSTPPIADTPKSDPVSFVETKIKEHLPEPIVSKAIPILGGIEEYRTRQAGDANESVNELVDTLHATAQAGVPQPKSDGAGWSTLGNGVAHGEIVKSPFAYVKLFFALIWQFVTTSPYVFYTLIFLLIFKLIRFLYRFFF